MDSKWVKLIERVDYAFQPIVNIYSGKTYAIEALIRNYESEDFKTIDSVFDTAYKENVLYALDMKLRKKALHKFSLCSFAHELKLFYNLDNRITTMPDFVSGKTVDMIHMEGLNQSNFCFELSEKHQAGAYAGIDHLVLNIYKQQGYKMAIDDFGVGFSGLQMLYRSEPDFIKIDRFFISDIDTNKKKKLFVSSIVEMCQAMGIFVVAEGVETLGEYEECKRLGCNMIQGYFIAKPTKNIEKINPAYNQIKKLTKKNRRVEKQVKNIEKYLETLPFIRENATLDNVFSYLRQNLKSTVIPIVSEDLSPIGIIKELDLKQYIYSQFGYSVLKNQTRGSIKNFIESCGVVDINDPLEKILKVYAYNSENGGILVVENKKYVGYLGAKVILDIINEKSLLDAREQNPLSGLAGNKIISHYISNALESKRSSCVMVYFDFDNFKPFNDFYGFRKGDRVILLFADILKGYSNLNNSLVGHIGGDDFFLGWCEKDETFIGAFHKIEEIVEKFSHDVESFYDEDAREKGFIHAKSRTGDIQKYSLLTVSAAMLLLPNDCNIREEAIAEEFSKLKKSAKLEKNHIAWATLLS